MSQHSSLGFCLGRESCEVSCNKGVVGRGLFLVMVVAAPCHQLSNLDHLRVPHMTTWLMLFSDVLPLLIQSASSLLLRP